MSHSAGILGHISVGLLIFFFAGLCIAQSAQPSVPEKIIIDTDIGDDIANNHRYIGKETSRHWQQGDDISMVDFRCAESSDGNMVADKAIESEL